MDRKLVEEVTKRRDVRRNLVSSADRSEKIRTYNYPQVDHLRADWRCTEADNRHLQDRVTDHRLGLSLNNVASVMEGEALQDFLDELAKKHQDELLEDAFTAA